GPVPVRRRLCRQDSARGEAGRHSGRATEKGRSHHQSDDRQGARADNPGGVLAACQRGPRMNGRAFIALLGGVAALRLAACAQERPLIAWLSGGARGGSVGFIDAFLQGMRELGYVESRNFDVVYRYADGYAERLPTLAEELVRLKPKVLLA